MSHWIFGAWIALLLALGVAQAQEQEPEQKPAPPTTDASPEPAPDRGFTPSQKVSPDQEVDFPADI